MAQLNHPSGQADSLSAPFTPGMRDSRDELAAMPDEIARPFELGPDPNPSQEFAAEWRNASYNCFSSGH
ncbi:MAG: hypothetical protein ACRDVZ_01870, partial [Jiangellaceae bacterium]